MLNIDFKNIRQLNGSQNYAFEELCAQLARAEIPSDAKFYRKAPPDAGIECYAALPNGDLWGWQAKYLHTLGHSQWRQIDKSVRTALEKHPRLVRYYICAPLDRTHAQLEKWENRVEEWQNLASDKGMTVDFIWWGRHELLALLERPEHAGKVRFFFNVERFDIEWFKARLDEAINSAGPRYTPKIHVELPIVHEFDALGRTQRFFDSIKSQIPELRREIQHIDYIISHLSDKTWDDIAPSILQVTRSIQPILAALSNTSPDPAGPLPLGQLAEQASQLAIKADNIANTLGNYKKDFEPRREKSGESRDKTVYHENPVRNLRDNFWGLRNRLQELEGFLKHADQVANASLLILTGDAGTGKTHLLCDVAKKRLEEGRPTVLLMGQRFTSTDEPWTQALQQLDLRDLQAEEFIGALEAAAQAAGCRALLIIDALNEGMGRHLWPNHLAAFLTRLERSPWIGVVLSVRSSYEEVVIPEEIRKRAVRIIHVGFAEHEYDAVRTFFTHFGLELPSAPILIPEFSNPLFLKMLCSGLQEKGKRRMPRGFHGITKLYELFLDAANSRLARELDFDPGDRLVHKALDKLSETLAQQEQRFLPRENAKVLINSLLPGRDFSRSLFRGLIVEGLLIEEMLEINGQREDVVLIAYERLADHLIVKHLLDKYLDAEAPARAFQKGGPLGFLQDPSRHVPLGLLEALCIQVSERTGKEILELAPSLKGQGWPVGHAFRQSLIWRDKGAFSDTTQKILRELIKTEDELHETLDVLLTIAILPEHPLNAAFLDKVLRKYSMPDRDTWWSTYLHYAYSSDYPAAVHSLLDWVLAIKPNQALEDDVIDLCSTTLAWMLTTSNRFLRDRATKALVNLLTGRLDAAVRLVERFANVDDPYVSERIYAVAYGIAMRSHDADKVGELAQCVYDKVFANGKPPAHILLRDYARGVVERALHLGAKVNIDETKIRPPYQSDWPHIPTEEEIKPYLPDWSRGSYDSGDLEWARNRIARSVLEDDFARYVIGTNSGRINWLSLRLDEPVWQSPDERLSALVAEFSEEEKKVWQAFEAADHALGEASLLFSTIIQKFKNGERADTHDLANLSDEGGPETFPPHIQELQRQREAALNELRTALTKSHLQRLKEFLSAKERGEAPPHFDLQLIQRYVLKRVFDLGWTIERFGYFDCFAIGYHGHAAGKAERIGKKYQWIAYHEIMAYIADHFQYHNLAGDRLYKGPWQERLRDIDPSCTLSKKPGGTSLDGHSPAWWCSVEYNNWEGTEDYCEWAKRHDDLPRVEDLFVVTCPKDGSRWVNLQGFFLWQQKTSPDQDFGESEQRELWYMCTGYFLRKEDAEAFINWAKNVDFWGRWMPEPPKIYEMFVGEYAWAPAFRYFQQPYYGDTGWSHPREDCPVKLRVASFNYVAESGGFDCSIDESYTIRLPAVDLVDGLRLRWTGDGGDFVDTSGQLVVFDPTVHEAGPDALLVRFNELVRFLEQKELTLCWVVIGEKRVVGPGFPPDYYASLRMSGAYRLCQESSKGFLKRSLEVSDAMS
ncbi:conserved hypothetical protein (plasmid) [Rhodothermus marinus DSM 4252]|uniref:ORC1/DEAH AAA+ ATPase domain-containing protein n=2 Tax=Rhodothermus marinus TaxID=29549 RepID=D0MKV0_RHOM4|nr:conserved hypothetical protein [Rhodothermus marinus DSM 4252]